MLSVTFKFQPEFGAADVDLIYSAYIYLLYLLSLNCKKGYEDIEYKKCL